jgi:hypothetical protein
MFGRGVFIAGVEVCKGGLADSSGAVVELYEVVGCPGGANYQFL